MTYRLEEFLLGAVVAIQRRLGGGLKNGVPFDLGKYTQEAAYSIPTCTVLLGARGLSKYISVRIGIVIWSPGTLNARSPQKSPFIERALLCLGFSSAISRAGHRRLLGLEEISNQQHFFRREK